MASRYNLLLSFLFLIFSKTDALRGWKTSDYVESADFPSTSSAKIGTGYSSSVENMTPSIVNGDNAGVGQYPYFAGLFLQYSSSKYAFYCGGTLIHQNWILTAAHCVQDKYNYQAVIGLYTTSSGSNSGQTKTVRTISANNIYKHPDFDSNTLENDFALLRIDTVSNIKPIKLDKGQYASSNLFEIVGFGSTGADGNGPTPGTLQKGVVHPISVSECGKRWGFNIDSSLQMCASGYGKEDVCKGDSGGPLIVDDTQVGVVSYGYMPCNLEDGPPVVYGRLTVAQPWIDQKINQGNDNQNYFVSNGKTTSRVSQQPGGSSSINLSWEGQENTNTDTNKQRHYSLNKKPQQEITGKIGARHEEAKQGSDQDGKLADISNKTISTNESNKQTFGGRVRQPPGGKSSFTFG